MSHDKNLRIHHYLTMVYERTKNIPEYEQIVHEISDLAEQFPDINKVLCTNELYVKNSYCWGVKKHTSVAYNTLVLTTRYNIVEIISSDTLPEITKCNNIYYVFSLPDDHMSFFSYVHILCDSGAYMCRGSVKFYV